MNATVKVYLNDGTEMFRKFNPDTAQLSLAVKFDLNFPLDCQHAIPTALELVFEQLNVGGELVEATEWCDEYRAAGHRSLSTGDVVVIGETAFSCDPFGWSIVSTGDLVTAINRAG